MADLPLLIHGSSLLTFGAVSPTPRVCGWEFVCCLVSPNFHSLSFSRLGAIALLIVIPGLVRSERCINSFLLRQTE